jgi:Family of unknown function (DUF5335)
MPARARVCRNRLARKVHPAGVAMAKSINTPTERKTIEVPRDQWNLFLNQFTRENRGAHARLSVIGPEVNYQVETENEPFDGVYADTKDRNCAAWITFGTTPADHFTHGVQNVAYIRALPASESRGAVLEVEAKDGVQTILELSRAEEYALPPGERESRR